MGDHIQLLSRIFTTLSQSDIIEINQRCQTLEEKQNACANLALTKILQEEHISQTPAEATVDYHETIHEILTEILRAEAGSSYQNCLKVLKTILENIQKEPENEKYKRIRLANPKFQTALGQHEIGLVLLEILGFQRQIENSEEILYLEEINSDNIAFALSIIAESQPRAPQPTPQPPRNEFLAKIHEERQNRPFQYVRPSKPQMQNDTTLQLQQYRSQKKSSYFNNRGPRFMTMADLDRQQYTPPTFQSPQPRYNSTTSLDDPRNIAIRAFQLSNDFRKSQGLHELVWNEGLGDVAKIHSKNMGDGKVAFGHDGFNERFRQFPIRYVKGGAENVAMSHGLADCAKVAVDG